jgi:hypothetical protein
MKIILKPAIPKLILAFVLFIIFSWLWRMYVISTISDTFPLGFPIQFFLAWGPCKAGEKCSEFNGLYLTLDLVFWYSVGSILVWRFQRQ